MRARYPDAEGFIYRNGAKVVYEVYDNDGPTILLAQSWQTAHSRLWKMQIPYLARHFRVVTYDPVGNGKSDRSQDANRYMLKEIIADALAVLDETKTDSCVVAGLSFGGGVVTTMAALHPERFDGVIPIAASHHWGVPVESDDGGAWETYGAEFWRDDWRAFVEKFFDVCNSDPHSTKGFDDSVAWAMETDGETIALASEGGPSYELEEIEAAVRSLMIPFLLIHGSGDKIISHASSVLLQEMIPNAELLTIDGAGHTPIGRYPVTVNHAIKDFVERVYGIERPDTRWHVGHARPKKVLFISSPIGLGHARRDVAIADELRVLQPDIGIDWLAQDPVTRVLNAAGETIHAASALMANESAHIESESGEHDLNAFQALRSMDEIQAANFMLIDEVISNGQYDLVVGDECWELDYQLLENPNLKKTAYAWLTDFVGYVPMPSGGDREAFVAADYNADMIEQIARYGRIRDKAIFVGNPDDIIPGTFGPGLPVIRDWTEENFDFAGYVTGFDPAKLGERSALRSQLGYHPDEKVCIVSVGGSGVGIDLIRRVVGGYEAAAGAISDLRMVVVTGPRIDPAGLPQVEGIEYREYVDKLYRHLAVADAAIVQGGLTTTMELTAAKVPFVYVPLRNHFEQNFHVRARLDRYRAGRFMDYEDVVPNNLAAVLAEEISSSVDYADVETDGAHRAATMISQLL